MDADERRHFIVGCGSGSLNETDKDRCQNRRNRYGAVMQG